MSIVRKAPTQNTTGFPMPEFSKDAFDVQIWNYGYEVIVQKAIECPCRTMGDNSSLSSCQNCLGTGWTFINPTQTKAIITGINRDTKYKPWSEELIGNIAATLRDIDYAGFMDRITILGEKSVFSEIRNIHTVETSTPGVYEYFCFLSYEAEEIENVFLFQTGTTKLLQVTDYEIKEGNKYVLTIPKAVYDLSPNKSISVRYKHPVQYNILDIPHAVRSSNIINKVGQIEKVKLPNQYIARLAHYVLRPNFDSTGIIDNSY